MNKTIKGLHDFCLWQRFRLILNKTKADSFLKKITAELTEELMLKVFQSFLKKKKAKYNTTRCYYTEQIFKKE